MKKVSTLHGTFDLYSIPLTFAQQHVPYVLCPPDCTHAPCEDPVILLVVSRSSRRSRRKGTGYFRNVQEFVGIMTTIMEPMPRYDIQAVAAQMRRRQLKTKSDNIDSIVRMLQRRAQVWGVDLPALFQSFHQP